MWEHANGDATAEHGLTAVRREHRRRRIATALKRTQLALGGPDRSRELVTWTQKGNEPMQALNRKLGYVDRSRRDHLRGAAAVITVRPVENDADIDTYLDVAEPRAPADADAARGRASRTGRSPTISI